MLIATENFSQLANINLLNSSINVEYNNDNYQILTNSAKIIEEIRSLAPFIRESSLEKPPIVSIHASIAPLSSELIAEIQEKGQEIAVDQSLYETTSSTGFRYELKDGSYLFFVAKTKTLLHFSPHTQIISISNRDENFLIVETNRLIKSLISISAESKGQLMLHASGVVTLEGSTLFLADSRNGKTTALLDTLAHFSVDMLSCDTSFLRIENQTLKARGWPSNFSVSVGTMYDYASLHNLIPPHFRNLTYKSAWDIYDKYVVDTKDVIRNAGVSIIPESTVTSIVALNFDPEAKTGVFPLNDINSIRSWLGKVYLGSRDSLYPNWHQYWTVSQEAIDMNIEKIAHFIWDKGIDVYQVNWAPSLQTLLRRIPVLDSFHKLHKTTTS